MKKYSIHSRDQKDWQFIQASDLEDPKSVFLRALVLYSLDEMNVHSFWSIGSANIETVKISDYKSASMVFRESGEELIRQVRDIPFLSDDAKVMLGSFFATRSTMYMGNTEICWSARAQTGIDELVAASILTCFPADDGLDASVFYEVTDFGYGYPKPSSQFMKENASFKPIQKVRDRALSADTEACSPGA